MMSRILIGIILLMTMGFSGCKTLIPETIEEDGRVSGLPYMYGTMLDIRYESEESIYAYDNQSNCFIPFDAMNELVSLFIPA